MLPTEEREAMRRLISSRHRGARVEISARGCAAAVVAKGGWQLTQMLVENLITVAAAAAIGLIVCAVFAWSEERIRRGSGTADETAEQRFDRLTGALSQAARVIQEIETEIRERREVADRLESDIETYNRIKDLNRAEVEA
jgi:hypothetical protein